MLTVRHFEAKDWGQVIPAPGISVFEPAPEILLRLETDQCALTLRNEVGKVVAYLGIRPLGSRRAECWALIAYDRTMREFSAIHQVALDHLAAYDADRIEAFVECDFLAGHQWVLKLGFQLEAPRMRKYYPDGKDCALYARVRE